MYKRQVVSHGYGITVGCGATIDVAPEHEMEKVLFAADELTGLIWAAALMRPSKSTKDMELKSLKKKYKSKGFAAGCSREVIERGAEQLGWELQKLLTMSPVSYTHLHLDDSFAQLIVWIIIAILFISVLLMSELDKY